MMAVPIRGRFVVAGVAAPDPLKAPAVARVAVGHGLGAAVDGHGHVAERKRDRLGNHSLGRGRRGSEVRVGRSRVRRVRRPCRCVSRLREASEVSAGRE